MACTPFRPLVQEGPDLGVLSPVPPTLTNDVALTTQLQNYERNEAKETAVPFLLKAILVKIGDFGIK